MKTKTLILLMAVCVSGWLIPALAQTTTNAPDDNSATAPDQPGQTALPPDGADMENGAAPDAGATPDQTAPDQGATDDQTTAPVPAENQPVTSTIILPKGNAPEAVPSAFTPPAQAMGTNQNDLNLNFKNAPLNMVLSYLSDAAGFIIVQDTPVNGTVTVIGQHLTQDQVVNLLNTELNRNGYAAVRDGRMLTIMSKTDAKTQNIPVLTGNDPGAIPDNDEIATWIIPIRYVEAQQLVSDLSAFVSPQATIVANQAGNSIVITDTQSNIRHLAEIIKSVDDSAQTETEIRVFRLKYANPNDVASELASIFPNSSSGNNAQAPVRFGGGGGRGGFFARMMAANSGGNSSENDRIQKATQVTAVADARLQAVIVSAPDDLMEQIAGMMTDLDVPSERDQHVSVISLNNADPYQVQQVLQNMFGSSTSSRGSSSSTTTTSPLMQRQENGTTTMGTTTTTSGIGNTGTVGGGNGGRSF